MPGAQDDRLATSGVVSHSPVEIARVLAMLAGRGQAILCDLAAGELIFVSQLRHIDPQNRFIVLDPDPNIAANAALLARPRASFHAEPPGWHLEFAASHPKELRWEGRPAIQLEFPDVLSTKQRRQHERVALPEVPLHFVADAAGVISFEGAMVDVSAGGIGLLQYAPNITLEPGTILRGCHIELPGQPPVAVDLEVRYSFLTRLPDGRSVVRSGCRFVELTPALRKALEGFFKHPL